MKTVRLHARPIPLPAGHSIGVRTENTTKIMAMVEHGLPFSALLRLVRKSGLSLVDVAGLIHIPRRTLMRRKAAGRLTPEESERLLRIARIFEHTVGLYAGNVGQARQWLVTPNRALDQHTPLDFARTEIGAREVEDVIGRLMYGVFT
jgi:putative toxin-antitoxin system antitoxin component (TIGR02293 family)